MTPTTEEIGALLERLDADAEKMRGTGLVPAGSEPLAAQAARRIRDLEKALTEIANCDDFSPGETAMAQIAKEALRSLSAPPPGDKTT